MSTAQTFAEKLKEMLFVPIHGLKPEQQALFTDSEGKVSAPKEIWGTYAIGRFGNKSRTVLVTQHGGVWLRAFIERVVPEEVEMLAPNGIMLKKWAQIFLFLDFTDEDLAERVRQVHPPVEPGK